MGEFFGERPLMTAPKRRLIRMQESKLIRLLDMVARIAIDDFSWQLQVGTSHLRHIRALWHHQVWTRWIGSVWAAIGVFTFLRDDIFEPTDEQWWKVINMIPHLPVAWWLFGFAAIFAIGIFEASFRLVNELNTEIEGNKDDRKNLRNYLAEFHHEGQSLMTRCIDKDSKPQIDSDSWAKKVEAFLINNLDASYVTRFRDDSNIAPMMPGGMTFTSPNYNLWGGLRVRVIRLNEFIKELSS
jgi:hypothetical protein